MHEYSLETEIKSFIENLFLETTIVTNGTLDALFSEKKHGSNALTLYMFYIRTGKRQDTNQPYATDKFCMKGLGWGKDRLKIAKKLLQKYNLIEPIQRRDIKGRIKGNYMKVNHMWSKNDALQKVFTHEHQNPLVDKPTSGKQTTNASSKSILNASSKYNINPTEKSFGNGEINELILFLKETMQIPKLDKSIQDNRRYANTCIKKYNGIDGVKRVILAAKHSNFWHNKVTSFSDVYYNGIKILSQTRGQQTYEI